MNIFCLSARARNPRQPPSWRRATRRAGRRSCTAGIRSCSRAAVGRRTYLRADARGGNGGGSRAHCGIGVLPVRQECGVCRPRRGERRHRRRRCPYAVRYRQRLGAFGTRAKRGDRRAQRGGGFLEGLAGIGTMRSIVPKKRHGRQRTASSLPRTSAESRRCCA